MFTIDDTTGHPVKRAIAIRDVEDPSVALANPHKVCRSYARDLVWLQALTKLVPKKLSHALLSRGSNYTECCWRLIQVCKDMEAKRMECDPGAVMDVYIKEERKIVTDLIKGSIEALEGKGEDPWECLRD